MIAHEHASQYGSPSPSQWGGGRGVGPDFRRFYTALEDRSVLRFQGRVAQVIGLSIEGLTSFSVAPLRLASLLGLGLAFAALCFGASILWETWLKGHSVPGYPSLVVGLMVLGGVQLIMIGIMGEYIGKILSEIKARPVYFVAEHSLRTAQGEVRDPLDLPPRAAAE